MRPGQVDKRSISKHVSLTAHLAAVYRSLLHTEIKRGGCTRRILAGIPRYTCMIMRLRVQTAYLH